MPATKYLTFIVGRDEYGVSIDDVKEVIGLLPCMPVPDAQPFVKGVVNLRGTVIPIVDLREKLLAAVGADTEETCTVVIVCHGLPVGLIVDRVVDVIDVTDGSIAAQPRIGGQAPPSWVRGMQATEDGVRFLVDADGLVTSDEALLPERLEEVGQGL